MSAHVRRARSGRMSLGPGAAASSMGATRRAVVHTWLRFFNEEATDLAPLEKVLGREFLRQILLGEAASNFPFPHRIRFRGVVTDRRDIDGVPHIEVAPMGIDRAAFHLLGGVLVPCERHLHPGALVDVSADLLDPDTYDTDLGVLARAAELRVLVPVEP